MREQEKIEFHRISLEDQEWMKQRFRETDFKACEFTFANNFIWREVYGVEVAQIMGCGVCRCKRNNLWIYSYPFGAGDRKAVIEKLCKICKLKHEKLYLFPLVAEQRQELLQWFPGQFEIDTHRDEYDYIYTYEKLAELKGKKLHGKRNHIARFKDDADWSYEPLTEENAGECLAMTQAWEKSRSDKWSTGMQQEMDVLTETLSLFQFLKLTGGVLRKAGKIAAFTIGEPLNSDTYVVHFEKALPDLQGAYPMINQQFVLHECQNFRYVNREEDTGDPGLRRAKLSYYPDILLKKYVAVESEVVFANHGEEAQIVNIWQECFRDDENYIRFYLENRFEEENMLVIHKDGKIVSMASFLPVSLMQNGEYVPARYVYAVATLPEYRKKGYAGQILDYAAKKYEEPLILQPADAELEKYYEKLGFCPGFRKNSFEITAERIESVPAWRKVTSENLVLPKEYKALRDAYFASEGYVCWDEDAIHYAIKENAFGGGKTLVIDDKILMYRMEGNVLRIIETTMEEEMLFSVGKKIGEETVFEKMVLCNAGGMVKYPEMDVQMSEQPRKHGEMGYLNLTLG